MPDRDSASDIRFIQTSLRLIKRHIKFVELGSGMLLLLAYTVAVLTVVVAADHAQAAGLSAEARRMARWAFFVGAIGLASWLALLPAVRRINDLFAARAVERRHPEFKNSLISALQLLSHADLPGSMQAALAGRAAGDLSVADVGQAVEKRRIRRAVWALAGATGLFVLYALLAPKPVGPSVRRALGIELPPPTRTQIVIEEPSPDFETTVDTPVRMVAHITGRRPDEAYVQFSADGGRTWLDDQQLALAPPPTVKTVDPTERQRWRAVKSGRDVQASMHYRFVAGDARSEIRLLRVWSYPEVADVSVRCEYPAYTGLSPTSHEGGSVDAVVGTQVTVHIRTTVPAESPPMLSFRKTERGRVRTEGDSESDRAFTGRFRIEANDEYTIDYRDVRGMRNRNPIVYVVKARPDEPPQISLDRPEDDVTLSASDAMGLVCDATDDFGLTDATLEFRVDERPGRISLAESAPAGRRTLHVERDIPLSRLGAGPGQEIVWWVTVRDNRHNTRGSPAYQSTRSEKRRITIRQDAASGRVTSRPDAKERAEENGSRPIDESASPDASKWAATQPQSDGAGREDPSAERTTHGESDESGLGEDLERFVETHRDALAAMAKHMHRNGDDASTEDGQTEDDASSADKTSDDRSGEGQSDKSQETDGRDSPESSSATKPSSAADEDEATGQDDAQGGESSGRQDQAGKEQSSLTQDAASSQASSDRTSQANDDQDHQDAQGKEQNDQEGADQTGDPSDSQSQQDAEGKQDEGQADDEKSDQEKADQANAPPDSQDEQAAEGEDGEGEAGKEQNSQEGSAQAENPSDSRAQQDAESNQDEGEVDSDRGDQEGTDQARTPSDGQGREGAQGEDSESEGGGEQDGQEGSAQTNSQSDSPGQQSAEGEEGEGQSGQKGSDETDGKSGDQSQQSDQSKADGKGESESEGGSKSKAKSGERQSEGDSQADCECKSDGEGKASNPDSKAGPEPAAGGGATDSSASNAPTPASPTTRPKLAEAEEFTGPTSAGRAPSATVDRVETLVDELERQLRQGQPDPNLLKVLDWTPDRARRFVQEFRRLEQGARPARAGASRAQGELETSTSQPGDDRWRSAAGRATDLKGATTIDRRTPDEIKQLYEVRRQQVGEQYRDLFEAYYKTVANLQPVESATTQAKRNP